MATGSKHFDLLVIGSGPAGQKAAIAAAKLKKKVAVIDRRGMVGGVCVHTGTIPSKTLREAILYLSGFQQKTFYGRDYCLKDQIAMQDLVFRVKTVVDYEVQVIRAQLKRNDVEPIVGVASFVDAHSLAVETDEGRLTVSADHVLIAVGTRPAHSATVPLDGSLVFDSDQILALGRIPKSIIVVGAGVIGIEYASMFTALGCDVTVIEERPEVLPFVDREIIEALCYHLRQHEGTLRLGESVAKVEKDERGKVVAHLNSGKRVVGDALLYTVGRQGNTDRLNLGAAGLAADARGRVGVNERFQTSVPHIYAAGDVIGFPALASTSMEQGRLAALHMFAQGRGADPNLLPYGIYSVPEISMVGKTEEELTKASVPYAVGVARYGELAKGQMLGDQTGFLKLLFCPESHKLLGVHAIGDRATEIIHIGQAVLAFQGAIEYFRDTVFNYPTLAEAYKVAAFDGLNRI
jgi:NAD(P) transhydrogenase